ncbi:hypothetical protein AAG607_13555 [Citromicrobium bathyomarinum]|uniref:hypothetical protein n=1 Tax=Citromicrobium bathyomarinum TaxID=72174 RepID=UPI00315AD65A
MHRIDTPGSVDGRFSDGNPAIGQQATQVLSKWFNAIQDEIVHVIERANIDLDDDDNEQLYEAIIALIAGVVGDGGGAVPTTRQLLGGGLVTGGGDLTANRTLTVAKASAAEAAAQTDDTKAVTPLALAGLVGRSVVGSSWVLTLGTTIVQIFSGTANPNGTTIFTLPQAFPNSGRGAWLSGGEQHPSASENNPFVSGIGQSSVSVFNAVGFSLSVTILAIGN